MKTLINRIARRWLVWRAAVAVDRAMKALDNVKTAEARLAKADRHT